MPDIETHLNVTIPIVTGVSVATIVGFLFDIEPAVLLAVFIGSWIGVAALPSIPTKTKRELFIRFHVTLILVLVCTFTSAYLVPIIFKVFPELAQKTIGAITGFGIVRFNKKIMDLCEPLLERLMNKIGS